MKKLTPILILLFFLISPTTSAQSPSKTEKLFLKELNFILQNSREQHWGFEGKMTIDSAFSINKEGILSVIVRYNDKGQIVRSKMEAPLKKIKRIAYDYYLILEFDENVVSSFASEVGREELILIDKSNLLHIGEGQKDGYKRQVKLEKLLIKLHKDFQK